MLKVGSGGQFCRPRKPSRFDGLVDATSSSSSSESSDSGSIITTEETLYKHYLQVIYTPVSSYFCLMRYVLQTTIFSYTYHNKQKGTKYHRSYSLLF